MIEQFKGFDDLLLHYRVIVGKKPAKKDLVYVKSQKAVFEVIYADRMTVRVERGHKGSGLTMTLPPSHYMIVEKI